MGISPIKTPDRVRAAHYGFTNEEVDFSSIKLRAGPSPGLGEGCYGIDYWGIDWNFQNDTFMNGWVTYRTGK